MKSFTSKLLLAIIIAAIATTPAYARSAAHHKRHINRKHTQNHGQSVNYSRGSTIR